MEANVPPFIGPSWKGLTTHTCGYEHVSKCGGDDAHASGNSHVVLVNPVGPGTVVTGFSVQTGVRHPAEIYNTEKFI